VPTLESEIGVKLTRVTTKGVPKSVPPAMLMPQGTLVDRLLNLTVSVYRFVMV